MLSGLRKVTRGWVAGILIGLLAVAFAIWGINDVFRPVARDAVASGDGVEIKGRDFENYLERALRAAREEQGQFITKAQAREQGIDRQILQELIGQAALDRLADRVGIRASDALIAQNIRETPAFKSQITGGFDLDAYRRVLADNNLTETEYEQQLRLQLARQTLAASAVSGLRAPASFGEFLIRFQNERRTVTVAELPAASLPAPGQPNDAELNAFYRENEAQLKTPEYRTLTIIEASLAAFEAKVEVPEADLKAAYDAQQARLTPPERRTFVEISGADPAQLSAAAKRIAAGEEALKVAASLGLESAVQTDLQRDQVTDAAVAVAVWALKPGAVSTVFKSAKGQSIAHLNTITPGKPPTFEEAREDLRRDLSRDQGVTLLNEAVDQFEDLRSGGKSIEDAAREAGLSVRKVGPVDAQGADRNGLPALVDQADLLKAAFQTAENETTEFVNAKEGDSRIARVDAVTPPGVRPLAEVREPLIQAWQARKVADAMKAKADTIVAEVRAGKTFAAAAKAAGLRTIMPSQPLDRRTATQGGLPQLGAAIFAAKDGDVVYAPAPGGAPVLLVAHVEKVERPDPKADPAALAQARQAAESMLANDMLAALQTSAIARAKVRTNDALLDQIMGVTAEDDAAAQ
jgi:peptidyl-prolyl cis-trans isomerase D